MIAQSTIAKARIVLESHHDFQYTNINRRTIIKEVGEFLKPRCNPSISTILGPPRSGITSLMSAIALKYSSSSLVVRCDIFECRVTLVDHVCEGLSLRSCGESCNEAPLYLKEFVKLTGRRFLIFDDLDKFISTSSDLDRIPKQIASLVIDSGCSVLYATSYDLLRRRIQHLPLENQYQFSVGETYPFSELKKIIRAFWQWCCVTLKVSLSCDCDFGEFNSRHDMVIGDVIEIAEVIFTRALIEKNCPDMSARLRAPVDLGDLRDEIESMLYE